MQPQGALRKGRFHVHPPSFEPDVASFARAVRVDCQVVRERDFKLLGDWALDLSSDGMLIVTRDVVLTGEEVIVSFPIPHTRIIVDSPRPPWPASSTEGARPIATAAPSGISFDSLEPEYRRLLRRRTLRQHPAAASVARAARRLRELRSPRRAHLRGPPMLHTPSFLAHANDRREIRRRVSLFCRVVRERDFKLVGTRAIDLSPDGMLVMAIRDVEPGDSLIVSFRATELGLWFDAESDRGARHPRTSPRRTAG